MSISNSNFDVPAVAIRTFSYLAIFGVICTLALSVISFFEGDTSSRIQDMIADKHNPYRDFNVLVNTVFFSLMKATSVSDSVIKLLGDDLGYYAVSYLRDLVLGTAVYWGAAGAWHLYIYRWKGDELFTKKNRPFPKTEVIQDQMILAQSALFLYAALPIFSEFLIENKLTKVYFYIDEVGGWTNYVLYLLAYVVFFEFGIYWMHRTLHENKFLYKYVHGLHHKYNKSSTLTPWASIAFNPIDGILQASPYVIGLFFVPVHYFTHVFLLFFSGVWATNIHDAMWGDTEPIMGSKYHTLHHTHYHYNFGQFFIFWDVAFGSFKAPEKSKLD